MKNLKTQIHKEFDEKFNEVVVEIENIPPYTFMNCRKDELKSFMDQSIDKAIAEERERIAKWADKNTGAGGDTPYGELLCAIANMPDSEDESIDEACKLLKLE